MSADRPRNGVTSRGALARVPGPCPRRRAARAALLIILTAVLPALPPALADDLPPAIDAKLPELPLDPDQISVYVRRVDDDLPTLAFNAETPRIPASVMKLLTVIAGLDILGPEHRWSTDVYVTGELHDGTLQGDMIVKGYGDPYLSNGTLAELIRALRAKGIVRIAGDLIFDDHYLAPPESDRGDFDGAAQSAYNALPAALGVNRQVTDIVVYHDPTNGHVGVYTDPPLSGVDIVNEAKLVKAACKGRFHRLQVGFSEPEGARPRIRVSGSFASECPDERIPRLLLPPAQHAASAFHARWQELGGQLQGHIRLGPVPDGARLFHRIESPPLGELVRDIDKLSNNLMARQLFLAIGIAREGPPGTPEKSRAAIQAWLAENGFGFPELIVDNGSGLSREARVSAASLGELLVWAYHQPWMPELVASLPIAGVDGTMRRRLRHEPIAGRAHLKTGTVRDASCIAGYVLDAQGNRWVVVVLVNAVEGQRLPAWHGHAVHHEILRWVYGGGA